MSLNSSGRISLKDIAKELGKEGKQISFHDQDVLTLAGKKQGQQVVLPNDFWGKSYASVPTEYPYSAVINQYGVIARNIYIELKGEEYLLTVLFIGNGGIFDCIFSSEIPHEKLTLVFETGFKIYLKKGNGKTFVQDEDREPEGNDQYPPSSTIHFNILVEESEQETFSTEEYILKVEEKDSSFGYVKGVGDITPKRFLDFKITAVYSYYTSYVVVELEESVSLPRKITMTVNGISLIISQSYLYPNKYEAYGHEVARIIREHKGRSLRIKLN